jgi:hypothetical protein
MIFLFLLFHSLLSFATFSSAYLFYWLDHQIKEDVNVGHVEKMRDVKMHTKFSYSNVNGKGNVHPITGNVHPRTGNEGPEGE